MTDGEGKTAVLVIDVQIGLFRTNPPPFEAEAVIAHINNLTAKARQAGAPVFFIQHDGSPGESWLVPFSEAWKLHPDLHLETSDLVIRKTACDAFYRTSLESELRSRGITTLVLTGYATDFCVDATLRNALSRDFRVIVAADAHTTSDGPTLKADSVRQHHNWAWANLTAKENVLVLPAREAAFLIQAH